jgi:hypothetical protein
MGELNTLGNILLAEYTAGFCCLFGSIGVWTKVSHLLGKGSTIW